MKLKFNMTQEENIFLAKRNIVDYIWKSANLEGIDLHTNPSTINHSLLYLDVIIK